MSIENVTPLPALIGGGLIGTAAALLLLFNGKIAGISGIAKGILGEWSTPQERLWRLAFISGLVLGGAGMVVWMPAATALPLKLNPLQMALGGLLVGIGTALGNGCTSGHGICGLARRSPRSLASVLTFMGVGFAVMFVMNILKVARF